MIGNFAVRCERGQRPRRRPAARQEFSSGKDDYHLAGDPGRTELQSTIRGLARNRIDQKRFALLRALMTSLKFAYWPFIPTLAFAPSFVCLQDAIFASVQRHPTAGTGPLRRSQGTDPRLVRLTWRDA